MDKHKDTQRESRLPHLYDITKGQLIVTGATLAASGVVDLLAHNSTVAVVGLIATGIAAHQSNTILDMVVPGRDGAQTIEATEQVMNYVAPVTQEYEDQSVGAKVKRLLFSKDPALYRRVARSQDADEWEEEEWEEDGEDELFFPEEEEEPVRTPRRRAGNLHRLQLAPDYTPHINEVLGRCILGVGQRGTGKSNLAARLIEQMGRYPIPMFIGDYKQDYLTLPEVLDRCVIAGAPTWDGQQGCEVYWPITSGNAERAGASIMQQGVQLVFECLTYETLDEAAQIMTRIIKGMFRWALKQPAGQRVPALVLLDEAQQFLPQDRGDSRVDPEISNQLFIQFEKLNSVGRSLGLTPAFFTQRIAQIRKEVIGGSEIFYLMRQTLPRDLKVYEELIGRDEKGKLLLDRRIVQKLSQGDGIVFEDGEFFVTHFDKRESSHLSTTPELEDAIAFYGERRRSLAWNEMEPLPMKQGPAVSAPPQSAPAGQQQEQQLYTTIHKLLTLYEDGRIDQEMFERLLNAIPGSPSGQEPEEEPQAVSKNEADQQPIDMELERAIVAYREGATSINKLAAAMDIKPYYAGPLLERVKKALQKRQAVNE